MSYYREVGHYYDKDAVDFERRYQLNPALQRIRQSFREARKISSTIHGTRGWVWSGI